MKYNRVHIESIGYELPPVVVSTAELENRLRPFLDAHEFPAPKIDLLTGIHERRWWEPHYKLSAGATAAAKHAISKSNVSPKYIDALIYAGVCREQFEPATACAVASNLGLKPQTVCDLSNACLGVLNGIVAVANQIELGQCKAGLVVSCESAREINDATIDRMNGLPKSAGRTEAEKLYRECVATLTGGSGAVAVLVTDKDLAQGHRRRLVGGTSMSEPEHHELCSWGMQSVSETTVGRFFKAEVPAVVGHVLGQTAKGLIQKGINLGLSGFDLGMYVLGHGVKTFDHGLRHIKVPFMTTHAGEVLRHGVDLGFRTWWTFLEKLGLAASQIDKIICHQVGSNNRDAILKRLGIDRAKDYSTFEYLGNMGTVSLPLTAALAEEREFLKPGDRVGFLGIGSGLNCMMLGLEW
jgi:acyl-CoA:acyl-CoA alkyltransferase